MNYQKIYDAIIAKAKSENRTRKSGQPLPYYESHHIIPKCMGGDGNLWQFGKHPNIVLLTPKEHYLCHYLLHKIYTDSQKLFVAFHKMCYSNTGKQQRFIPSSSVYQYVREQLSKYRTGKNNPMYGKIIIHKGNEQTVIKKEDLDQWLRKGWLKGNCDKVKATKTGSARTRHKPKYTRSHGEETKKKINKAKMGSLNPMYGKIPVHVCKIHNPSTNEIYVSKKDAANKLNISLFVLERYLKEGIVKKL